MISAREKVNFQDLQSFEIELNLTGYYVEKYFTLREHIRNILLQKNLIAYLAIFEIRILHPHKIRH